MGKINVIDEQGTLHQMKVVENLNYNHDLGCYAKVVKDVNGNERIVKRPPGGKIWSFHKVDVQPLIDHLIKMEQRRHKDVDTNNSW